MASKVRAESGAEWQILKLGHTTGQRPGSLVFVIFISPIDEAVTQVEIIKKFADDTKIGQKFVTEQDKRDMQQARDNLSTWAARWGMEFNIPKCKVMHLGHNNLHNEYLMNG